MHKLWQILSTDYEVQGNSTYSLYSLPNQEECLATINISTVEDNFIEDEEYFYLSLVSDNFIVDIGTPRVNITIHDDDSESK